MVATPHAKIKPAMFHDAEKLKRLWDALAWLASYDPMTVDDIEGEFQISVHERKVMPRTPRAKKLRRGVLA